MRGEIAVERSVAALPKGWDALAQGDMYCSRPWLSMLERTYADAAYYVLHPSGRVGLVAYAFTAESSPSPHMRPDLVLRRLAEEDPVDVEPADHRSVLPALTCGGRRGYQSRVLMASSASSDDVAELVASLPAVARAAGCRSVVFPFVDERDSALTAMLDAAGYRSRAAGVHAYLPVTWDDFDGYLSHLSRKRREDARSELREIDRAGVTLRSGPLVPELVPELAQLEVELNAKHGTERGLVAAEHSLRALLDVAPATVTVARAERDARTLGFVVVIGSGGGGHLRQAGFRYADQGRLPLYFAVVFYEVARQAPERGWAVLHYGTGTTAAKVSRGCALAPQRLYVASV